MRASMERPGSRDVALLVLRCAGLLLALGHGWGKISALATGNGDWVVGVASGIGFPAPVIFAWALAIAEFVGGICVAFGLFTRPFAFLGVCAMFTAAFFRHRALMHLLAWLGLAHPTAEQIRAAGDPERALLFLLLNAGILVLGPGAYSLDRWLSRRRR